MKQHTYFKAIAVFALMLAALAGFAYLFKQSLGNDSGEQEHLQSSIYNLKQVDANWTAEVLKSYVGISKDYDALSKSSRHLPQLLSNLSVDLLAHPNKEADNTRSELNRMIKEKEQLIEKFKRRNAVLKNSLRYLPTAQAEMTAAMSNESMVRTKQINRQAVDQLVAAVLHYNLFPEEIMAANVRMQIDNVRNVIRAMSPALSDKTNNLIRHVEVILNERTDLAALVAKINDIGISSKLDALSLAIDKTRSIELDLHAERRNITMLYGTTVLFMFIAIIIWTTRRIVRLNEVSYNARALARNGTQADRKRYGITSD